MIDKDTFARYAIASSQMQYRVSWAILGNKVDCSDAMQEALLKAWAARHKLRDENFFTTWLIRILINECRAIQRKRAKHVLVSDTYEAGETHMPDLDIQQAIDKLPEKLRLPLILHHWEGYPIKDIARMLKMPTGTVKNRLLEARKQLRDELKYDEEVQPYEKR